MRFIFLEYTERILLPLKFSSETTSHQRKFQPLDIFFAQIWIKFKLSSIRFQSQINE